MNDINDHLLARIHRLATGQLEGTLSDDQRRELADLLAADADARRAYMEHMQDTASLRWIFSGHCDRRTILPMARAWAHGASERFPAWVNWRSVLAAAAAAAIVAMALGNWIYDRSIRIATSDQANQPRKLADSLPAPVEPVEVATLTSIAAVTWDATTGVPNLLSRVEVGQQLSLTTGSIELTFDTGAQVRIFAPAKIEVSSPRSILCSRGRVTTLVGKSGKGFTIDTPKARIVDLGTQFGVDISEAGDTQVVVFQGSVDLKRPVARGAEENAAGDDARWTRRMNQGEALLVGDDDQPQRVVAVQRSDFIPSASARFGGRKTLPTILDVRDNIRAGESTKCYQIVHRGMREDAPCFVDRVHQWNGVDAAGMPEILFDADYIMPFNDDKFVSDLRVEVDVAVPSTFYIFFDDNMSPPKWLRESFKDTGYDVGLDGAKTIWHTDHDLADGAGTSIDFSFSVWSRTIDRPGTVVLGGVEPPQESPRSSGFNMYGIAVAPK